jgi:hypothetical protein
VLSNVVGFDDGPFDRNRPGGQVLLVGAVCARTRLDGLLTGRVRHDGWNVTERMAALVEGSAFREHIQAVLLAGSPSRASTSSTSTAWPRAWAAGAGGGAPAPAPGEDPARPWRTCPGRAALGLIERAGTMEPAARSWSSAPGCRWRRRGSCWPPPRCTATCPSRCGWRT